MSTTNEVIWEEPEEIASNRLGWFWDELKKNPGRWARYPGAKTAVYTVVNSRTDGEWEALTQGGVALVRYLGEATEQAAS
jgi:hypothetical protein